MIDSQKTLVAYLDIMGYKKIVNKSPDEFYDSIVSVFEGFHLFMDFVQPKKLESRKEIEQQCLTDLIKTVKFKIMSDAIIMYCDFNDIECVNKKYNNNEKDLDCVGLVLFFKVISIFVFLFITGTGYFLRGGICLGKFYTNTFESFLDGELVFSEALVRGFELEQLADHPRVLVDEPLYDIWKSSLESPSVQKSITEGLIKRDRDGELYLDIYEFLRGFPEAAKKIGLANIIKQIKIMLAKKEDDRCIWKKWHWFKEYHNEKIKSFAKSENQDLNELLIN